MVSWLYFLVGLIDQDPLSMSSSLWLIICMFMEMNEMDVFINEILYMVQMMVFPTSKYSNNLPADVETLTVQYIYEYIKPIYL